MKLKLTGITRNNIKCNRTVTLTEYIGCDTVESIHEVVLVLDITTRKVFMAMKIHKK